MLQHKTKRIRLLGLLLAMALAITACTGVKGEEETPLDSAIKLPANNADMIESTEDSDTEASTAGNTGASMGAYAYAPEDMDSAWDAGTATSITFGGSTAQISGDGAVFANGSLSISQAGTYELSGALTDGQILIDAGKKDIVRLVLNGVSLSYGSGPAIFAAQSSKVVLILADGTQNTVSDGAAYANTGEDDPDAAIFIQDDLSITGGGALTVTGSYKHGIRTQDVLAITGGVLHVTAAGDGLRGRDGVAILDGSFTLIAGGDGMQSNNADDDTKGFVVIEGGTYTIQAKCDGVQAESALRVIGGSLQITTGGGSANAPVQEADFRGGRAAVETTAEEEDTISMKALKAGKQLVITGGDIVIDAEDDAVHSNDTVSVTGGSLTIRTGDDGLHADAALEITGGDIDISYCYEGIEGLSVTISGGDIAVTASDDAINAAGGTDSTSTTGGPMGRDRFAANGDIFIRISGGTLDLYAPHDGIDANGNVFIEGGAMKISGPSQGMEGAIDLDGSMSVTGGEFITAGSVMSVSQNSTQPVLLVSYTDQQASGSVIAIKDAGGNTLLEYTSRTTYALSGFTSPAFTLGETYTLYINGEKKTDITLESMITSISDSGGAYGGTGGGMGGGRGDGGGGRGGQTRPGSGQTPPDGTQAPPDGGQAPPDGGQAPPDGGLPPPDGGQMPPGGDAPPAA